MNTGFKHRIVEHLQQRELDDAQWQQLRSLQQRANGSRSRRRPALVALAASLLLALLVGLTLDWTDQDLSRQIADEVAMNHLKQRPLEVVGSTLDDLRPYFDELEFQLLEPSNWQASSFGLAGGRYCSVRGVTAAQLRLHDDDGGSDTLYQVTYDRSRFGEIPNVGKGESPLAVRVRGLRVDLWVEKGLLFALVHGGQTEE